MKIGEILAEAWSQKYKSSINCSHPRGFSQKAHCAGKKKHNESVEMEMVCESCGMCQTHGNLSEVKQRLDAKCWKGKHKEGTKIKGGVRVNNCVPNESVDPGVAEGSLEEVDRRGFLRGMGAAAVAGAAGAGAYMNRGTSNFERNGGVYVDQLLNLYAAKKFNNEQDEIFKICQQLIGEYLQQNPKMRDIVNSEYRLTVKQQTPQDRIEVVKNARSIIQDFKEFLKGGDPLPRHLKDLNGGDEFKESVEQGVAEGLHEQFDAIEEMVEAFARHHGVDAEQIWEDFESVDDLELLDESAAWRRKEGKNKKGGLNAKGVASYRRENPGSKLQTAVTTKPSKLKPGSKAAKRRKSFCARMGGVKGPMKKPNGKPTRKALALRKWNC